MMVDGFAERGGIILTPVSIAYGVLPRQGYVLVQEVSASFWKILFALS